MNPSDEMLMAYADGELSGEELRVLEVALRTRPDLQAFVEQQRKLRARFDVGFASVMGEEIPDCLHAAVSETPMSRRWRWQQAFHQSGQTSLGRRLLLWSAMPAGAALACGLAIGVLLTPQGSFLMDRGKGAMSARGELAMVLDRQLASAQQAVGDIRVGLSFKSKDGRYCRTFSDASYVGVACRDKTGWAVAALARAPHESSTYRMADAMPDAIRDTVEKMIAGEPLDAMAEKSARDQGWKAR